MSDANITPPPRACDACSKCCEGWLQGSTFDKKFWRGRPCHYFIGSKCSIYSERPEDPCRVFRCEWLSNDNIPGWMRPDQVMAIMVSRQREGHNFLEINEAGEKLRAEVLSWAVMYCLERNLNLVYFIDGGVNRIGSQEFLALEW